MAGIAWITGAEHLHASLPGGTITSGAPPRAVWHTTEATSGQAAMWQTMQRVLTSKSAEPNVLYDPVTDQLGQFFALDLSGRALKNDGTTRTNRTGTVCIQIEVIGYAAKPFTTGWKPGPNFRNLMAALRSWGIPEAWPAGPPPRYVASPPHNVPESPRSRAVWLGKAGHYGHSQVPANSHGDPGGIDVSKLFGAGRPAQPPKEPGMAAEDADRVIQFIKDTQALTGTEGGRYAQEINENRGQTKILQAAIEKQTLAIEALTAAIKQNKPPNTG